MASASSTIVQVKGVRGSYSYDEADEIGRGSFGVVFRGHGKVRKGYVL